MPLVRRALTGPPVLRSSRRLPALTGSSTTSSVHVTPERSLQIGAVYSCVRLLSEAVAGLPVGMFQRKQGVRLPVETDPVLTLVKDQPNPDIDAGEFWRTILGWMLLRGNAYAYIQRNGAGAPIGLWPISPQSIEVKRADSGRLVYAVKLQSDEYCPTPPGGWNIPAGDMLHYRAFGLGVEGLSPIGLARQSVGIAFAAQSYVGGFFARDASPGGIVAVEGELTDVQYERLEKQWKAMHEGFDKAHKLAIMEGGAKWEKTTLAPADAQFIETQKFTRGEIASIYGVPPHLIGDTEKSTSWGTGLAEQGIGFVTYSLRPWLNRLERVTNAKLFPKDSDKRLRWNVAGLMQGDMKARYDAYAVGRQWGWLSTNDILKREDEAPLTDGGDEYLVPLNMVPAGSATPPNTRSDRSVWDQVAENDPRRLRQCRACGTHWDTVETAADCYERDLRNGYSPAPVRRTANTDEDPAQVLTAWVTRHRDLLVSMFAEQRDDVIDAIREGREPLDRDHWDAELTGRLLAQFVGLAREVASRVATEFGGTYTAEWALAYLASAAARQASNINITTQNEIQRALDDADDDTTPADRVAHVFDEAEGSRAGLVAIGIVNQIGNFGRHEGARQGGATHKTWRTTSSQPRAAHARMDGETVPIDETFSNRANYPHDPAAGADDTAGCKCRVEFTTEES